MCWKLIWVSKFSKVMKDPAPYSDWVMVMPNLYGEYVWIGNICLHSVALKLWTMPGDILLEDRKSTRLNSSHTVISYAVFCLKKKKRIIRDERRQRIKKNSACTSSSYRGRPSKTQARPVARVQLLARA